MQDTAIQKYMAKHEKDGMPSVLDMLYTLNDYEQTVIDSEVHGRGLGPEGSLLSLKMTKTDVRHRDITLKDVSGLQFVVERETRPPGPPIWYPQQGLPILPQYSHRLQHRLLFHIMQVEAIMYCKTTKCS